MASRIETLLEEILNAVYGEEVRGSIHDAIEECYSDVSNAKTAADSSVTAANYAAGLANTAASSANEAASSANEAATEANTAAGNANEAASNVTSVITAATTATSAANKARDDATSAANDANSAATSARASIEGLDTIISNANAATSAANTAAASANEAADNATLATTNANTATSAANTAASNANAAISLANDAADSANAAATSANAAATSANSAAQSANSSASSATSAANSANTAASTANSRISDMDLALTDASSAIQSANNAAAAANQSSILADSSKRSCDDAAYAAQTASTAANTNATRALNAAAAIENMTVVGESIASTVPSYVEITEVNGHKHLHFYIQKGEQGASFTIKGTAYPTLADLQADITNPIEGDIYQVGTEPPYELYRWTGNLWEDQGQITMSIDALSTTDVDLLWAGSSIIGDSKYLEQNGLKYLITNKIKTALDNKVDAVDGKQLTTIDFTQSYVNRIDSLESNVEVLANTKVTKEDNRGLSTNDFTDAYKLKLDNIAPGATKNTVDDVLSDSSTNSVQNKVINAAITDLESAHSTIINNFAAEYDPEVTYNINDICIKDKVLYKCITEISTPEVWNSEHWSQTSLNGIVSSLSEIDDNSASASKTWSSSKISNSINSLIADTTESTVSTWSSNKISSEISSIIDDNYDRTTSTWSAVKLIEERDRLGNAQLIFGMIQANSSGSSPNYQITVTSPSNFEDQTSYPTVFFLKSYVYIPTVESGTGEATKTVRIGVNVYNIAKNEPVVKSSDYVIIYKPPGSSYLKMFPLQYSSVQSIYGIIGTELVTTEATTLRGAINELDADITALSTSLKPKIVTLSVGTTWSGSGPYTQEITIDGGTANTKVDLQPDSTVINQMVSDGCMALYVVNDNGVFTLYALDAAPSTALNIQATLTEVQ